METRNATDADMKTHVESLIKKAAEDTDATNALKYSQAALNAANAIAVLATKPV